MYVLKKNKSDEYVISKSKYVTLSSYAILFMQM